MPKLEIVEFANSVGSGEAHNEPPHLGPEVIIFSMLNSAENEILNAHKYKNI